MAKNSSTKSENFEASLFKTADKLRKNIEASEYKHIVLGLIFLKYISDSFEELHTKLEEGKGKFEGADTEDQDEYKAENVFWVPKNARWEYLHSRSKLPTIGKDLDDAMELIEKENPTLSIEKIKELDYMLSPGRYVGLPEEEDDFDFAEKFTTLKTY